MIKIFTFFLIALLPVSLQAQPQTQFMVFGVRNEFPMKLGESTRKDFYVNIGTDQGVKKGTKLQAFRTLTAPDEMNSNKAKTIRFPIAILEVIHAQPSVAVARMIKILPESETPIGLFPSIMIGDHVSVSAR